MNRLYKIQKISKSLNTKKSYPNKRFLYKTKFLVFTIGRLAKNTFKLRE